MLWRKAWSRFGGGLDRVLADLRALSEESSRARCSRAGDLLSSSHGAGVDRERVAAMLAALVNLSRGWPERTARSTPRSQGRYRRGDTS
jgi:hypothetical protein